MKACHKTKFKKSPWTSQKQRKKNTHKPITSSLLTHFIHHSTQTPWSSSSSLCSSLSWDYETLKTCPSSGTRSALLKPPPPPRMNPDSAVNGPKFWLANACSDVIALIARIHVRRQRRWSLRTTIYGGGGSSGGGVSSLRMPRSRLSAEDFTIHDVIKSMVVEWIYGKNVEKGHITQKSNTFGFSLWYLFGINTQKL